MDDVLLLDYWRRPESELTEWKPSLSQTESIYQTVCAYANDYAGTHQEGVIFIGRRDDGSCADLEIDDQDVLDFVGNIRTSGSILPLPVISYRQTQIDGCAMLALIVKPSNSTPVFFGQKVYIRQGPSSRKANPHEITTLTERRISTTFDSCAANGATLGDLDTFYLQEEYIPSAVDQQVLKENSCTLNQQLASLRILTPQFEPTNLGLLIAGSDSRWFLPGAYVQFLRINGTELGDPIIDQMEISGRIDEILRLTYDKLRAFIEVRNAFDERGRTVERSNYPFEALTELVANAIVHRNYETSNAPVRINWFNDRIEIHNPGGPYGQVTDQNFGQPMVTDYRNPELAAALKNLGYVQRFGYGIANARKKLRANDNADIEFEPRKSENYVLATVRPA